MIIIRSREELRNELKRRRGETVGFVPTMGFLHEGHLSLVEASKHSTDITVVSIFVNPTQFGPNEDYERYPRDEAHDLSVLETAEADIVFLPTPEEIYPDGNVTDVTIKAKITKTLCAKTRPTHFDGVTNVVARLLCLIRPDKAFFGRKDAQQLAIIQRMAKDLLLGTEIVGCPIVREPNGLARSSRNTYLSEKDRRGALSISQSLFAVNQSVEAGMSVDDIKSGIAVSIEIAGGRVDYVSIVHPDTLEDLSKIDGDYMVAIAAYFGTTRLIDNIVRVDGKCI